MEFGPETPVGIFLLILLFLTSHIRRVILFHLFPDHITGRKGSYHIV